MDAANVATEVATVRAPGRWAWIVPLVSALVIVALAALILGNTIFAGDPMAGT